MELPLLTQTPPLTLVDRSDTHTQTHTRAHTHTSKEWHKAAADRCLICSLKIKCESYREKLFQKKKERDSTSSKMWHNQTPTAVWIHREISCLLANTLADCLEPVSISKQTHSTLNRRRNTCSGTCFFSLTRPIACSSRCPDLVFGVVSKMLQPQKRKKKKGESN